jgi:hypothetical protein
MNYPDLKALRRILSRIKPDGKDEKYHFYGILHNFTAFDSI